jgi:hypothetical protein
MAGREYKEIELTLCKKKIEEIAITARELLNVENGRTEMLTRGRIFQKLQN